MLFRSNDPGHWFNESGNVVSYGSNSVVFSELNPEDLSVNIGNFPNLVSVDSTYTIKQAFVSDKKQVNLVFNVKISESSTTDISSVLANNKDKLNLYYTSDKKMRLGLSDLQ